MRNDNKPVLGYGSQYYLSGKVGEVFQGLWYCIGLTICCTAILVGGLEHFLFFHSVGNFIIPTDFHIFQRVETTNQNSFMAHPARHRSTWLDGRGFQDPRAGREGWLG